MSTELQQMMKRAAKAGTAQTSGEEESDTEDAGRNEQTFAPEHLTEGGGRLIARAVGRAMCVSVLAAADEWRRGAGAIKDGWQATPQRSSLRIGFMR